jgi:hypothetical protein
MNNFSGPSFFKIRLANFIIGILVVCFLLGAERNIFAQTYDCLVIASRFSSAAAMPYRTYGGTGSTCTIYRRETAAWNGSSWVLGPSVSRDCKNAPVEAYSTASSDGVMMQVYGWRSDLVPARWSFSNGFALSFYTAQLYRDSVSTNQITEWNISSASALDTKYPNGCVDLPDPCEDEYQAQIAACGGEENIINWDPATCTGECDACPHDPDKTAPGICGCGVPDTDTDGDGTPNCNDGCPEDPTTNDLVKCTAQQNLGDSCQ